VSLIGVILIARPTALFGSSSHASISMPNHGIDGTTDVTPGAEKGTATDRLIAVG